MVGKETSILSKCRWIEGLVECVGGCVKQVGELVCAWRGKTL